VGISRSAVLGQGTLTTVGFHTVFTCPEGQFALLKHATLAEQLGAANSVQLWVARPAGASVQLTAQPVAANDQVDYERWHVLEAGDQLSINIQPGRIAYWISGTLLDVGP